MTNKTFKFFRSIDSTFWVFLLAFLGLAIRLYLAQVPGFKYDVGSFYYWAVRLSEVPLHEFYSDEVFSDYTPGYLYILWILGTIKEIFGIGQDSFLYIIKIPSMLAEIAIGLLVYAIAKKENLKERLSLILSASVFFNPGLIFNSAIWGQVDGVLTLALIFSVMFLKSKKYILASIFLGIAFLIKPQTIAIFPLFGLFALKNINMRIWLKLIVPFFAVLIFISFPFFPENPLFQLKDKVVSTAEHYHYTALGTYNTWGIVGYWIDDIENTYFGISYQIWGFIMLAIFWLIVAFVYFKKGIPLYTLAALATMAFYFLPTRVHERYLYPALVFLILSAIEFKSEIILYIQDILSLIYFVNLYRVFIYYNEEVLNTYQAFFMPSVYNFLAGQDKIISQWVTIFFVVISIYLLKKSYVQKA